MTRFISLYFARIFTNTNAIDIATPVLETFINDVTPQNVSSFYNMPFKSYGFFKITVGSIYFNEII